MPAPIVDDAYILNTLIDLLKYSAGAITLLAGIVWKQLNRKIDKGQIVAAASSEAIKTSLSELSEKIAEKVTDLDRRQIHSEIYIGELKRRFNDIEHDVTGKHCSVGEKA